MVNNHSNLSAEQTLAIAEQLVNSSQSQQAMQLLLESFNKQPSHAGLALGLARLLHQHQHNKDALIILNTAYRLGSRHPELVYMLGALLHVEKYFEEAENIIKEYLTINPNSAEAFNLLGANYIEQNHYQDAVNAYRSSIKMKPESADAYNNIAWAYRAMGKKHEAILNFEQAFLIDNTATEALSGLLMLKTFKEQSKEFDLAEQCLNKPNLSTKQKTELEFAIGKAYEDIAHYEKAFTYFKKANQTWRRSLNYQIQDDQEFFSKLKDTFPPQPNFDDKCTIADNTLQPIFILGMPRSSTTLIEQIVSAHSKVVGGGELPFLERLLLDPQHNALFQTKSRETLNKIALSYYESINKQILNETTPSSIYVTDKLPLNFRFIGVILQAFPKAKIIHCRRDPMDTCLSLYKHHFPMANHGYAYNLKELGQYYNLYEDLMQHWHRVAPGKILDIQYEALLDNFESDVKKMLTFCGLEFEIDCLEFQNNKRVVRTASSDQVRQGLFKSGSGRWLNYEKQLAELKASLQSYS